MMTLAEVRQRAAQAGIRVPQADEPVPEPAGADAEPGDLYGPQEDDDDD